MAQQPTGPDLGGAPPPTGQPLDPTTGQPFGPPPGQPVGQPYGQPLAPPYGQPYQHYGAAPVTQPMVDQPAPVRPKRRAWVLIFGGWMTFCWLLLIVSAVTAFLGGIVLAILGMLPINLLWRFKYWRARKTPTYNVVSDPRRVYEERYTGKMYVSTESFGSMMFRYGFNKGVGSMVTGFLFPVRDFFAELRGRRRV